MTSAAGDREPPSTDSPLTPSPHCSQTEFLHVNGGALLISTFDVQSFNLVARCNHMTGIPTQLQMATSRGVALALNRRRTMRALVIAVCVGLAGCAKSPQAGPSAAPIPVT